MQALDAAITHLEQILGRCVHDKHILDSTSDPCLHYPHPFHVVNKLRELGDSSQDEETARIPRLPEGLVQAEKQRYGDCGDTFGIRLLHLWEIHGV